MCFIFIFFSGMEEAENRADEEESRGGKEKERKRREGEECR